MKKSIFYVLPFLVFSSCFITSCGGDGGGDKKPEVIKYTVKFDTTGCNETYPDQVIIKGNKIRNPGFPTHEEDPDNYFCYGWNLNEEWFDFETVIGGDITLKPAFTSNKLDIKLNGVDTTKNINIDDINEAYLFTAYKDGIKIEDPNVVNWYAYSKIVDIDEYGNMSIPSNCVGGTEYIVGASQIDNIIYYGSYEIEVATFNTNKLTFTDDGNDNYKISCPVSEEAERKALEMGHVVIPNRMYDNINNKWKYFSGFNGTTNIFEYCEKLTSMRLPENLTSIPQNCFHECQNLASVNIPDSVVTIGNACFFDCYSLSEVNITPASKLTSLPKDLFFYCYALNNFYIPDTVTSIGSGVFQRTGITSIIIPAKCNSIGSQAFDSINLANAYFEITKTWTASTPKGDKVALSEEDLSNPTTAGTLLCQPSYYTPKGYCDYNWKRTD